MPTHESLPDQPNLRHLKDQARDLLRSGTQPSLAKAQFAIARKYGFANWAKLKAHVESLEEIGQLKQAIDRNDLKRVQEMVTRNPELHRAPLGYGKDGTLTWVAECRVPWEPPGETRLAMAQWLIDHGSDVNQGSGGPLGRAALNGVRIPMMELLVRNGADVNAVWRGSFPILFSPCEAVDPVVLEWLLTHGAEPNLQPVTALDYLLGTYVRDTGRFRACIEILLRHGGRTKHDQPGVLDILRGRHAELSERLDQDRNLVAATYPDLDIGTTAARMLTLKGGTLLHVAAEFANAEAARLLLDRGADVNARGAFGQTPLFHAATQNEDFGFELVELLLARGADLSIRAVVPGYYEREGEMLDCTAVEYSDLFPGYPGRTTAKLHAAA